MRILIKIFLIAIAVFLLQVLSNTAFGQPCEGKYVRFAIGTCGIRDTARADGSLYVSNLLRLPLYANSDANKVLSVDANGFVVLQSGGAGTGTVYSITASAPLTGGTITSAGSIGLATTGTAGTKGSATQIPVFLTDAWGRVTSSTNTTVTANWTDLLNVPATIVYTSSSYADPSWITAIAYSKITGVPSFITLASLSATAPMSYNNLTGVFSMPVATGSVDGYLSAANWTIFNGKQDALGYTPENVANKATDFSVINNTKYPTTAAIDNLLTADFSLYYTKTASDARFAPITMPLQTVLANGDTTTYGIRVVRSLSDVQTSNDGWLAFMGWNLVAGDTSGRLNLRNKKDPITGLYSEVVNITTANGNAFMHIGSGPSNTSSAVHNGITITANTTNNTATIQIRTKNSNSYMEYDSVGFTRHDNGGFTSRFYFPALTQNNSVQIANHSHTTDNITTSTTTTGTGFPYANGSVISFLTGSSSQFVKADGSLDGSTYLTALPGLANGKFWVGNGSGVATAVTSSGDVTFDNAGAFSIGTAKVTNGMLAGSITASKLVGTDINTVGTITIGTWTATKISEAYGGTNQNTYTAGDMLYASATNTLSKLPIGSSAQMMIVNGGISSWQTMSGDATITIAGVITIKSSVSLAGSPTTTTQSVGDNSTKIATTAYVDGNFTLLSGKNVQSGTSYTLVASDINKTVIFTSNSAITLTIPSGLGANFYCSVEQNGTGNVTFTASGTTLHTYPASQTKTAGQYAIVDIRYSDVTNTYNLQGATQ